MTPQEGATTRELMARLGHASAAAAQRYQHAASRRDKAIADALEVVVAEALRIQSSDSTEALRVSRPGTRLTGWPR